LLARVARARAATRTHLVPQNAANAAKASAKLRPLLRLVCHEPAATPRQIDFAAKKLRPRTPMKCSKPQRHALELAAEALVLVGKPLQQRQLLLRLQLDAWWPGVKVS
jgi:hypothetical protein